MVCRNRLSVAIARSTANHLVYYLIFLVHGVQVKKTTFGPQATKMDGEQDVTTAKNIIKFKVKPGVKRGTQASDSVRLHVS